MDNYGDLVDYWITFNEPHVFAMLTYCAGAWPGGDPAMLEQVTAAMPKGVFKVVMKAMADSHLAAYDIIHNSRYLNFLIGLLILLFSLLQRFVAAVFKKKS